VEPSYEIFDHTADAGLRIRAATPTKLLKPAAEGLYAIIGELVTEGRPSPQPMEFTGSDDSILLRDYLAELLHFFEQDARVATAVDVEAFGEGRLAVTVHLSRIYAARTVYHREVKAITYHELDIRTIPGGCEATVIVDI
jgi:SHS2 domain-containing protein